MYYCKCQDVTDEGWPVISMVMGSNVLQHMFYFRAEDYLMKHDKQSEFKCSILVHEL